LAARLYLFPLLAEHDHCEDDEPDGNADPTGEVTGDDV
jgi:hypothetical protein